MVAAAYRRQCPSTAMVRTAVHVDEKGEGLCWDRPGCSALLSIPHSLRLTEAFQSPRMPFRLPGCIQYREEREN